MALVWLSSGANPLAAQEPLPDQAPPGAASSSDEVAVGEAQAAARPRIGLALGGGAARGIAHIGLIEWFEEHHIPIDYIAGTSMGGLIGGAYSSGMTTKEMRELMLTTDWDLMFLADSPFKYKTFRRKEDARAFPGQIDFGLKGGFTLPSGLNSGQQIELMLDRIGAPYSNVASFDELPTPFRCVATDLKGSGAVVLDSGSLARAMRATMAIPGVFTPVEYGDRLLVDGGALNNVPADVVRSMGATVVIAVNVGASTDAPPAPKSLFAILGQTIDTMMSVGTTAALKNADLVVTPPLKGLTGMDWRKSEELADRGYQAAEALKDELLKYAVDEATWEAWRRQRESRRSALTAPTIAFVRVEGSDEPWHSGMVRDLEAAHVGRPFNPSALEQDLLKFTGTDRYEVIGYALAREGDKTGLDVKVTQKSYGPPFLLPAIDLTNVDSDTFAVNLRARVVFYDTLVKNSELRVDVGLGSRKFAGIELYHRLFGSRVFVSPRAYYTRDPVNGYNAEGEFVTEYRDTTTGAGIDIGLDLGPRNEVRVGYSADDVRLRRRIGEETFPEAAGGNRYASLRWTHDGQNSPVIPSRGVFSRAWLRYYFATPDLEYVDGKVPGPEDLWQGEARVYYFKRVGEHHRLMFGASGGTSFGDQSAYNQFRLGGLLRLGAFNKDAVRGDSYVLGLAGLLYRMGRLPDVLGGNLYLGGWLEAGSAFDDWDTAEGRWDVTGGIILETILAPFFIGGSFSLTSGDGRFYINLGPFLR